MSTAKLVGRERARFAYNWSGIPVAILIAVAFFVGYPALMRAIWPHLQAFKDVHNLPPMLCYGLFNTVQHILTYGIAFPAMWVVYVSKFRCCEKYRAYHLTGESDQWPWESMPAKEWSAFFRRSLSINFVNACVCDPCWTYLVYVLICCGVLYDPHPDSIEEIPGPLKFAAECLFCMIFEDLTFYFGHRFLHQPWNYQNLHKIHHENQVTFCLSAMHAHPIEYLFFNIVPTMIGPLLLAHRQHWASIFGWYMLRSLESLDGHCGYAFPWSPFRLLPFNPEGDYHYYHHVVNMGNYGTFFTWCDTVFGTNSDFYRK